MVMLVSEMKDEIVEKLLDEDDYQGEFKRDGNRLEIHYKNNEFEFYNRKGVIYTKDIPDIIKNTLIEAMKKDKYCTSFIIDGELTYTDNKGIDHRTQAQCKEAEPVLWIWDIQELSGEDLRPLPWIERKVELGTLSNIYGFHYSNLNETNPIRFLPSYKDKRALLKVAEEQKLEGIILKKTDAPYEDGKVKTQIKIKFAKTDDYIVVGYTDASEKSINSKGEEIDNKRYPYFKALCLAQYNEAGELVSKGQVGGGFKDEDLDEILPMLHKGEKPLTNPHNFTDKNFGQAKGKVNWIPYPYWFPIEIKMQNLTEYGNPFQPRFLKIRNDKLNKECIE